jgi:hypothetical protein
MPHTLSKMRFSWIALTAFLGASLAAGDASAACPSEPAGKLSRPARCCKAPKSADSVRVVAAPAKARPCILPQNADACPYVPGCCCCPPAPPAPEPKGQRAEENRHDPGRITEAGWLDSGGVSRPFIGPVPPTGSPPQTSPLYLRNSRLLI